MTNDELETGTIEKMRQVAHRCINAEKIAWTALFLAEHGIGEAPRQDHNHRDCQCSAQLVLTNTLEAYLANTASMVKAIQMERLVIDIAKAKNMIAKAEE